MAEFKNRSSVHERPVTSGIICAVWLWIKNHLSQRGQHAVCLLVFAPNDEGHFYNKGYYNAPYIEKNRFRDKIMAFKFLTPEVLLQTIAAKAKARRLTLNLSRRTLAANAGVSEASIKRFETTGEISFRSLLKLAFALDSMGEFESLFDEKPPQSIAELQVKPKQRGRL